MLKKISVLIRSALLLLLLSPVAPATVAAQTELPKPKKVTRHVTDTLLLTYNNHLPVIEVQINGLGYQFLIDTGSSVCASFSPDINSVLTDIFTVTLTGENGNTSRITAGKLDRLKIGKHEFHNVYLSAQDFQSIRCQGIDGVIGYSVLRDLCVKFDVRKGICIVSDDNTVVKAENKSLKTSFEITNGGMPVLRVSPMPRLDQSVGLDTGSGEFYLLSQRHYQAQKNIFGRAVRDVSDGGQARLTLLSYDRQELRRKFGFPNFKFGNISVRDTEAQLIDDRNSYLGGALLELGTLTLDYRNRNYYFQPFETISSAPKMQDVTIVPSNKGLEAGIVWRMSAAYEKGIRVAQRVIAVNGETVTDPCQTLFRISQSGIWALTTVDDEGNRYEWEDETLMRQLRRQ